MGGTTVNPPLPSPVISSQPIQVEPGGPTLATVVQKTSAPDASSITLNGVASGHTLMVGIGTNGVAPSDFSVSDAINGNWTRQARVSYTGGTTLVYSIVSAAGNVTAEFNYTGVLITSAVMIEVADIGSLDQTDSALGAGGLTLSVGPTADLQAIGELVVVVASQNTATSYTASGGYTLQDSAIYDAGACVAIETKVATSTQGQSGEFTVGSDATYASIVILTFQPVNAALVTNPALVIQNQPGAINGLQVLGTGTGSPPQIAAIGSDTDIDIDLVPQGSGKVTVSGQALPTTKSIYYAIPGALTVADGNPRLYMSEAGTISGIRASVGTSPAGASIIVDVWKNGATIYTTSANRPTIAAGSYTVAAALPDDTTLAVGDYLTINVDQIGSATAGSDLVVEIDYAPS